MPQAKTLTAAQFAQILDTVATNARSTFLACRDTVILLLSFKAGLRAAEIAGLNWSDVTDAFGTIRKDYLHVPSKIAKKGHGRNVPMHPELYEGLCLLHEALGPDKTGPRDSIVRAVKEKPGDARVNPNTLQRYIGRLFESLGLIDCSSHSGRRSFITAAARVANAHGCSLRDVQGLAGHSYLDTTQLYIEPSERIHKLVESL